MGDSLWTPAVDDVVAIHDDIVAEYPNTEGGVRDRGAIAFVVDRVEQGPPGDAEEDVHDRAVLLLRLLVANHPFVDANKRTALDTVATFYTLNGYRLEYGEEVRSILQRLATDERGVDADAVREYLRARTTATDTDDLLGGVRDDLVEYGLERYREERGDEE